MADIFDELLGPNGAPPQELIAALRRQRALGQVGALSGDKNISRLGGSMHDDALKAATEVRDRRDRDAARKAQQEFAMQQQQMASDDRKAQREYQYAALKQAGEIAAANRANARDIAGLKQSAGLTPFDKEYQRKAAQESVDWDSRGRPVAEQSLAVRGDARAKLADPKAEDKGGEVLPGLVPDWARTVYNKDRVALQQAINSITVQNLREAFGAQFTQKETEQFRSLEYDPSLTNEQNLAKFDRKIGLIQRLAAGKDAVVRKARGNAAIGNGGALDSEVAAIMEDGL